MTELFKEAQDEIKLVIATPDKRSLPDGESTGYTVGSDDARHSHEHNEPTKTGTTTIDRIDSDHTLSRSDQVQLNNNKSVIETNAMNGARVDESDKNIGQVINDRFELISLLGTGGMSKAFKARDLQSGGLVALKVLTPERLKDEKNIERFIQEAKTVSVLKHENICSITEFGQDAQQAPYLVMEYADGITLAEALRIEGAFDLQRVTDITRQISAGLSHAHERGIVHRDIKPSNIFLSIDKDGKEHVKVLDFGIAKVFDQLGSPHMPLTETGEFLGTPWYMSPEQCFGQITDARSDTYQVGCLLYEMLTGKRPYEGSNAFEVMFKHVTGLPGLEGFDPELQSILAKALEKNPDERYRSLEEFVRVLNLFAVGKLDSSKAINDKTPLWRLSLARLSAAGSDALLVGIFSSLAIYLMRSAPWMEVGWPNSSPIQEPLWRTLIAFGLGCFDSIAVWPSLVLSVLANRSWYYSMDLSSIPGMDTLSRIDFPVIPVTVLLINWLYHAGFESSRLKSTPGKLLCGLQIINNNQKKLTFFQASCRHFSKAFSMLLLPEIVDLIHQASKGKYKDVKQLISKHLRRPLHDRAGNFSLLQSNKSKRIKSFFGAGVAAILLTSTICTLPWLAYTCKNYDLAIAMNPSFTEAYEEKASELLTGGKFKEALQPIEKAHKLDPKRGELYAKEAAAYMQLHDYKLAEQALKEGLVNCASSRSERYHITEYLPKIMALSEGKFSFAIEEFQKIQKTTPANPDEKLFVAELYQKLGTADSMPGQVTRQVLFETDKNRFLATEIFKSALESQQERLYWSRNSDSRYPIWPDNYQNAAQAALRLGDYKAAIGYCNSAISAAQHLETLSRYKSSKTSMILSKAMTFVLRGKTYQQLGKQAEAMKDFNDSLPLFEQWLKEQKVRSGFDSLPEVFTEAKAYATRAYAYAQLDLKALTDKDQAAAADKGMVYDVQDGL